ncbi:unnamed protein product [Phaedon cochleariae]|uniref:Enoyl-CoA hydratase n=1 Tax=Phaedon cochleariae TaxID=80249 RepID=A0A9P0DLW4_PHACE|nr:unnamed protein product [Phaedon cochleariae]
MNYILQTYKDGVKTIKFNKPQRKNALSSDMYQALREILTEDAKNDKIVVTIITGTGDYFTSGNDLKSAMSNPEPKEVKLKLVQDMIEAFIAYPKLLIAVVNGRAIGIGATVVALCDIVYATDDAVFEAPFVEIGLCAEGCSSYTFPYILGRSKASEVLYLGHKLSAEEALQFGLVSKIIPQAQLESFIAGLHKYGKIPVQSLIINKALVMSNWKKGLSRSNAREFKQLGECVDSEEFSNAVIAFMSRKSKL